MRVIQRGPQASLRSISQMGNELPQGQSYARPYSQALSRKSYRMLHGYWLCGKVEPSGGSVPWIGPVYSRLPNYICLLSNFVGDPDSDINCANKYLCWVYYIISSDEVCLTFCESGEGNQVRDWTSKRHPKSSVQFFLN